MKKLKTKEDKSGLKRISKVAARKIISLLAGQFDVPVPKIVWEKTDSEVYGLYNQTKQKITIHGTVYLDIVAHEFAHHVQYCRRKARKQNIRRVDIYHNLGFHRICFELQNFLKDTFSVHTAFINGAPWTSTTQSPSYYKAQREYDVR